MPHGDLMPEYRSRRRYNPDGAIRAATRTAGAAVVLWREAAAALYFLVATRGRGKARA